MLLGVLAILSACAIVLSLSTAPGVSQQELQTAARNTTDASSFVLDYNVRTFTTLSPTASRGKPVETGAEAVEFDYQAPDRVLEVRSQNGEVVSFLIAGHESYERLGSGPWSKLPSASPQTSQGAQVVSQVLSVLHPMAHAHSVVRSGSTYRFKPETGDPFVKDLFGTTALSKVGVTPAALSGGLVADEGISASASGMLYDIAFSFHLVGVAPPVKIPKRVQG